MFVMTAVHISPARRRPDGLQRLRMQLLSHVLFRVDTGNLIIVHYTLQIAMTVRAIAN